MVKWTTQKHAKTLISGAFGTSSDFCIGQRLITILPTDRMSQLVNNFVFPRGWKKLAVALNSMGRFRNRKQDPFFLRLINIKEAFKIRIKIQKWAMNEKGFYL